MDIDPEIPRSFVQPPFNRWYRSLVLINKKPKNQKLAFECFLSEFSDLNQDFYEFVQRIKKYLKSESDESSKIELAQKYLMCISTLCERFGFFEEKSEIDDLAFELTLPEVYEKIQKNLEKYKHDSQKIIKNILRNLRKVLRKNGYKSRVSGRYKNLYSIYKKNQKKRKKDIFELNDIFAFRVIVNRDQVENCFSILNLFHDAFIPVPQYFKNYIDIPKINGYKSLHTGLNGIIPDFYLPVEVQIRTKIMDEYAEKGLAAHWLYSQKKQSIILNESDQPSLNPFLNGKDRHSVYCLSFIGDIFQLKKGSNIMDFAAKIHSELPLKVREATVNGEKKTIRYLIKNGDIIHLITTK